MKLATSPPPENPRLGPAIVAPERTEEVQPEGVAQRGAADNAVQRGSDDNAVQRVVKVRRDYNSWVARETMEDYALRFTPHSFRKWSEMRVPNTAFGAASFLILAAVGATLLVQFGFLNAFGAILATGVILCLAGLPRSMYAGRPGLVRDLLTRGAACG